jgi:predicted signal transduction protein with EAL and GGDEF domain
LRLKTVAEGVETPKQVEILGELGCDAMQGFLIHRPAPANDVSLWLTGLKAAQAGAGAVEVSLRGSGRRASNTGRPAG